MWRCCTRRDALPGLWEDLKAKGMGGSAGLKIAGGVVGVLLAGSVYGHLRRKRRDKRAAELLREVAKLVKPTTQGLLSENAFDIHFVDEVLKKVSGKVLVIKHAAAVKYAKRIHDAWGAWYEGGDDENKVYAVFRELKDKVAVSQVASAYQDAYKENLIDTLHDRMDDAEVNTVLDIVKPLPSYRTL